jgi:DNA-binding MarR family transcriptional regulator
VCVEILSRTGAITAGELAELSGLTTGAVTGVVDRLEKAGLVRRANDPNDRRRVILEPLPEPRAGIEQDPYAVLLQALHEAYPRYSDAQMVLLLDLVRQLVDIYDEQAARLRTVNASAASAPVAGEPALPAEPPIARLRADANIRMIAEAKIQTGKSSKAERTFSAPLDHHSAARLELSSGPGDLKLNSLRDATELYRAHFRHTIPTVRVQENEVAIQYRHRTLFGREGGEADIALNPLVPWDLQLQTGPGSILAELRGLKLRGLALASGASKIVMNLPAPKGQVDVRVEGGMSDIMIRRPSGVPVRVELRGGTSRFSLDRQRAVNVQEDVRESSGYGRAADSYRIAIEGGASKISVEESR